MYYIVLFVAMNLLLCYHALNDSEKLKRHFQKMVQIVTGTDYDEDRYSATDVSNYCRVYCML